jgi:hypothetical protein
LEYLRSREGFVCRFSGEVDGGRLQMADGLVCYVVNQKQRVFGRGLQRI